MFKGLQRALLASHVHHIANKFMEATDNLLAPPTYSSPAPDVYQDTVMKIQPLQQNWPSAYQSYDHRFGDPQELPAEHTSPLEHRHSELPAQGSFRKSNLTISELQADSMRAATELESPQTAYSTDLAKQMNQNDEAKPDREYKEKK